MAEVDISSHTHSLLNMLFSSPFFLLFPPFLFFSSSPPWFITSIMYTHSTSQLIYCLDQCSSSIKKETQQAQHTTGTQLWEPGRTRGRDREQNHPTSKSTSSTTFCTPSQYSKSARIGQCQGRRKDPARHSWNTGGLRLKTLQAKET